MSVLRRVFGRRPYAQRASPQVAQMKRPMVTIDWEFVRAHAGVLSWSAVESGLHWGYAGDDVAIGCAEARMVGSDERALVDLAIEDDPHGISERVASLAAAESGGAVKPTWRAVVPPWLGGPGDEADPQVKRLWQYLALAWVFDGRPEPGRDPAPEPSTLAECVESLWAAFGHPAELSFAVYYLPPGDGWVEREAPFDPTAGLDFSTCVRPRLALWLDAERIELGFPAVS